MALARAVILFGGFTALAAGCGSGGDSMVVRERFEAVQAPHRIAGTTSSARQIVRNDCTISAITRSVRRQGPLF
jgi:hypothetical protein